MRVKTERFGELVVESGDRVEIPQGVLGFPECKDYCLVDPNDDTLILWMQSTERPERVFPVLEPKIFMPNYKVTLSAADRRELGLDRGGRTAVFSILTIPQDVGQMTANIKAPIVVNVDLQVAKQVVLQENEYAIKHAMFKELKTHLITIQSNRDKTEQDAPKQAPGQNSIVPVNHLPVSEVVGGTLLN